MHTLQRVWNSPLINNNYPWSDPAGHLGKSKFLELSTEG